MDLEATRYAITLLRGWVHGDAALPPLPGDVDPQAFLEVIQRNRLEGMVHTLLPSVEDEGWGPVRTACEDAYRRNLLHGLRQLRAGTDLVAQFQAAGVDSVAMRGPFAGVDVYGDVGVRRFTDLDLYVPSQQRRAAWNAALAAGYRLVRDGLPRGFFERHHLHWPLVRRDGATSCDLHWALDHPYKLQRVDYDALFATSEERTADGCAWRQPAPDHLVLSAAIHLGKHCREGQALAYVADGGHQAAEHGWLRYWLEVAAVVRRYHDRLDWERLADTARRWMVGDAYQASLAGVAALFESPVPSALSQDRPQASAPTRTTPPGWVREVSKLGGFQDDRVSDARSYLFPHAAYFQEKNPAARALHRVAHTAQAAPRLLLATGEALVWPAWAKLTRRDRQAPEPTEQAESNVETGPRP